MNKRRTKSAKRKAPACRQAGKVKTQSLKFLVLSFGFTFFVLHSALSCFAQDKIVAVVNNDVITQKDLNDFINFMRVQLQTQYKGADLENKIQSIKLDLLNKLIEDRLILQEARKNNIKIDGNKVGARINEMRKYYGSDAQFQNALGRQGLTQSDIELRIREQLLMYSIIDTKIRSGIVVGPFEVTDLYQNNIKDFKMTEQCEVTAISVDNEDLANGIFNKLKDGNELDSVANKYSLVINKINVRQDGKFIKEFEDAVFKLNVGQISRPIKVNESFYIVRLDNKIDSRQENLSEAQDKIYAYLMEKKMQEKLTSWLDELKKNSYIKIFTD